MTSIERPCPSCGSANVKWRRRRWYDALLGLPVSLLTFLGPSRSTDGVSYATSASLPNMIAFLHGQKLTSHAHITHAHVPGPSEQPSPVAREFYYRCRNCGGRGKHFEQPSFSRHATDDAPSPPRV